MAHRPHGVYYRPEATRNHHNVKRNLNDKSQLSNGEIHFTREWVDLVMHTNFTAMCYRSRLLINKFNARGTGYELERRFGKFVEITQSKSHYAVQGQSMSPILVPIESTYSTSY